MESTPLSGRPKPKKKLALGCWIWWDRPDKSRGGPAQIFLLVLTKKSRWAFVEYEGNGVWINEECITEIVRGSGRIQK